MRKPDFCLCENKAADQLCTADQLLCFHYMGSKLLLYLFQTLQASSFLTSLCRTWSETPETGFIALQLIYFVPPFSHLIFTKEK